MSRQQTPGSATRSGGKNTVAPGLYVTATPIGNSADISLRALDVLARADLVLCEDTRVTAKLLALHGIAARTAPYHDHNAAKVRPEILARLDAGETIALVSDAGTPTVADPGYKLIREAVARGLPVTTLPGPSAVIAALTLAALPTDRFLFAGFPPPKQSARRAWYKGMAGLDATLVFYESPKRLAASLADAALVLGDRPAAVARELTKMFEEVRRAPLSDLAGHYAEAGAPKGEIVVVVGPPDEKTAAREIDLDGALKSALETRSVKEAVAHVAAETGLPRREVYARALALKPAKKNE
ncbi:MAG TPA: 16S rRNA (cytidine(1402)-2'-O)-methyltransferase [Alphaproteobacteria bacterium]|nr:16S rRNA (cytidine(1402)-2'-O)-methyltransferase [Alphaproteobacteria bacterium]